jgi:hypothetical protein
MNPVTDTDINFLTKMQKRANSPELKLSFFNDKSPMSFSFRGLKIFRIMSTDCNHTNIYALLHNLKLGGVVGLDVIFSLH